jgi:hypothetical protein
MNERRRKEQKAQCYFTQRGDNCLSCLLLRDANGKCTRLPQLTNTNKTNGYDKFRNNNCTMTLLTLGVWPCGVDFWFAE